MPDPNPSRVSVVGAGLSGAVMAVYLAKRGYEVDLFEKRGDPRGGLASAGRSVNMTLATRGLEALSRIVDLSEILDITIPLEGRMVHAVDGSTRFSPYGILKTEVIHAVMRSMLNVRLVEIASRYPNINFFFNHRCGEIDAKTPALEVINNETHERSMRNPKFIVGADGTFSAVRSQMQRTERADFHQEYLESGYRELTIPAAPNGTHRLFKNALHIWPRGRTMFMAIPNLDGSFACNCILPMHGEESFSTLTTASAVMEFFERKFPDVANLVPGLPHSLLHYPPATFLTTRSQPWHFNRVVLIGDACHTVVPFYGQGMNAAFEDCSVLDDSLAKHSTVEAAFSEYQQQRKRNTDALAHLSVENFFELRDKVRSPVVRARKAINLSLHRLVPDTVIPLYTLISHTSVPYADALERVKKQDRVLNWCGAGILIYLLAALYWAVDQIRETGARSFGAAPAQNQPKRREAAAAGGASRAHKEEFAKSAAK